jgi:beta-galactosidase
LHQSEPAHRRSGAFLMMAIMLTIASLSLTTAMHAQSVREHRSFDNGWRFHLGDVTNGQAPAIADRGWREVDLPHDWSIEGPFSATNASGTAFLPGGTGWYRKTFDVPASMRGRQVSVRFDGVYRNSDVWINGKHLGHRPYGYSTFEYDLTPHLEVGSAQNVIAVRVDRPVVADSRWYPGTGIYRHVWLEVTGPMHIAPWGVYVTTPVVRDTEALVSVETRLVNETRAGQQVSLTTTVIDERGETIASATGADSIATGADRTFAQQVVVPRPKLWSPEHPQLYAVVSRAFVNGTLVDEQRTPFGVRTIAFTANDGFVLNGVSTKLKGVCIHHDLGALGAAFYEEALERRLRELKKIGVNAIRFSHNPMAPEAYDLADRMGFLVMDEAFDEWIGGKRKWAEGWNLGAVARRGYHEEFERWGVRDVQDMVLRSRNHPSVIMWSIGNEIDYPDDPFTNPRGRDGVKPNSLSANLMPAIARRLISAVKQLDTSRPVTMALADINASNATGVADMLDVVGYNYQEQFYERDHKAYPNRVIYGSENSRSLDAWRPVAVNAWVPGQFLWTGIDFLGEARRFPTHGSSAGLLDIEGFWKPSAYLRQAIWDSTPMVYAAAWTTGDEASRPDWLRSIGRTPLSERWAAPGETRSTVPVEVYSNCDSVELFLNGRTLGVKRIADRLMPALLWSVPNERGVVEAVAIKGGQPVARFQLKSTGKAERIELTPDRSVVLANGRQVATIVARLVDAEGNRVPDANLVVTFEVTGAGRALAVGNGDLTDNSISRTEKKAFQGRLVAVVRSAGESAGKVTIRATAPGLPAAETVLEVRP